MYPDKNRAYLYTGKNGRARAGILSPGVLIVSVFLLIITWGMPQAFAQKLPPATENHIRNFSDAEKIEYLGKQCWELREKSNEEAILYGRYAVSLADSLKLYSAAAEISNFLGVAMLYYIYDTQKAWEHFRDALNYSIISNDSIQLGFANDNLGYMYLIHGDLDRALEHESTAEKIFIQQDFESGIAYVSDNLGLIQQKKRQLRPGFLLFPESPRHS